MESKELLMYNCEFTWWDDTAYPGERQVKCVVAGYSLTDAVQRVASCYGDDQIENLSIEVIDDTECGVMEVSIE